MSRDISWNELFDLLFDKSVVHIVERRSVLKIARAPLKAFRALPFR